MKGKSDDLRKAAEQLFGFVNLLRYLEREKHLVSAVMKAISILDETAQAIIKKRYLAREPATVNYISKLLNIHTATYHRTLQSAFEKIDEQMNIAEFNRTAAARIASYVRKDNH